MAFGWDDAALALAVTAGGAAASAGASALGGGGGASASDQRDYWDMMHNPLLFNGSRDDEFGNPNPSRAQIENYLEAEQYRRQLGYSAQANLDYNAALNRIQPLAMRQGLERAGYNPLLGVLGNYNASNSSISAPGGQSVAQPTITRPMKGLNSSVSFDSLARSLVGAYKASTDNTKADTDVKGAQVADVQAGAKLKDATADNIKAKTETEHLLRDERLRQLENENAFGKSIWGDYGRAIRNALDGAIDTVKQVPATVQELFLMPDTSSANQQKRSDDSVKVSVPRSAGESTSSRSKDRNDRYLIDANRPRGRFVIPLTGGLDRL